MEKYDLTGEEKIEREEQAINEPNFIPSHELSNTEQDEIWNTNDGYAE